MAAIIYRVEDAYGEGPYAGNDGPHKPSLMAWTNATDNWNYDETPCPSPYTDSAIHWPSVDTKRDWRFGFKSLKALKTWFGGDGDDGIHLRDRLNDAGFYIALYRATTFRHGGKQSIFLRPTAERIGSQPVTHVEGLIAELSALVVALERDGRLGGSEIAAKSVDYLQASVYAATSRLSTYTTERTFPWAT